MTHPKNATKSLDALIDGVMDIADRVDEEANKAYVWAENRLMSKHPPIAYEHGVRAGYKVGAKEVGEPLAAALREFDKMARYASAHGCDCGGDTGEGTYENECYIHEAHRKIRAILEGKSG